MKPTEILTQEHRVIECGLDCLMKLVEQSETAAKLDAEAAKKVCDFLRNYADKYHHGKEEAQLFPLMKTKKGFSGGCSPVMVMIREHELGRLYVGGMESHIAGAAEGDADGLRWFIENAKSYMRLLREHIKKEDHCLFPAANRSLTDEDQSSLLQAFAKVDSEGVSERYLPIVNQLAEHFGVPRSR